MMKKILFILSLFYCGFAFGQRMPNDSATGYIHYQYAKGIWYPKISGDRVVTIPADTIYSKFGIAVKGTAMYVGNGVSWTAITGAATDTTNKFMNTMYRLPGIDSIYFNIGGNVYSIKDSVGSGSGGGSNNSIGSAFKIAIGVDSRDIKTLAAGYGVLLDSATTGQIKFTLDSATVYGVVRSTINDSIDANTVTFRNPDSGDTLVTQPSAGVVLVKSFVPGYGTLSDNVTDTTFGSAVDTTVIATVTSVRDSVSLKLNISDVKYDSVQNAGVTKTQRRRLNFSSKFLATDNIGNSSTDISPLVGIGNKTDSIANVLDFGAFADGSTDDSVALKAAIATGRPVYLPKGVYKTNATISLQYAQKLFGEGTITTSAVGSISPAYYGMHNVLVLTHRNIVDGITFTGSGKTTFTPTDYYTTQNAIQLKGNDITVRNCRFFGMAGSAILGMDYDGTFHDSKSNLIVDCIMNQNTVGVYNFIAGDYQTISNCMIDSNYYGVIQESSNAKIIGSTINYNNIGFFFNGDYGDRGMVAATTLNHNSGYAIQINNVLRGYNFTGCEILANNVLITNCDNIAFSGCNIGTNGTFNISGTSTTKTTSITGGIETFTNTYNVTGTAILLKAGILIANQNDYRISGNTNILDSLTIGKNRVVDDLDSAYTKDRVTGKVAYSKITGSNSVMTGVIGVTTNYPLSGDSAILNTNFINKKVQVFYGGILYSKYSFNSTTGRIVFADTFATNDVITIYTLPLSTVDITPQDGWSDVEYPTRANLTEVSNIWTASGSGWSGIALSGTSFIGNGSYIVQYNSTDGYNGIIGFNLSNTSEGYAGYEYGLYLQSNTGVVYDVTNGVPGSSIGTVTNGQYVGLNRTGSTVTIYKSSDKVNWSPMHTFATTTTATLYLNLNLFASFKAYYPQYKL